MYGNISQASAAQSSEVAVPKEGARARALEKNDAFGQPVSIDFSTVTMQTEVHGTECSRQESGHPLCLRAHFGKYVVLSNAIPLIEATL